MKKLIKATLVIMLLCMSIKPAIAKKQHHQPKSKTLQEYVHKLCKVSCINSKRLANNIKLASKKHRVPKNLLLAVLKAESKFSKQAYYIGNYGLMQVNLTTHKRKFRGMSPFNVETNIDIGASILGKCFENSNKVIKDTLVCYKGSDVKKYQNEVIVAMSNLARFEY